MQRHLKLAVTRLQERAKKEKEEYRKSQDAMWLEQAQDHHDRAKAVHAVHRTVVSLQPRLRKKPRHGGQQTGVHGFLMQLVEERTGLEVARATLRYEWLTRHKTESRVGARLEKALKALDTQIEVYKQEHDQIWRKVRDADTES